MTNMLKDKTSDQPRVLILSQRNTLKDILFRGPHQEFEDIICQIDSADLLAPSTERWFNVRYEAAKRLIWHAPVALNPGVAKIRLKEKYDLFFAICGSLVDLLMVNAVENWKDAARTSICLVDELWIKELPGYKYMLDMLAKFDYVMLYYSQSVKPVSAATGRECFFVPPGIDTIAFSPYPEVPRRVIDVYSIGRRSQVTHESLLRMVKDGGAVYLYDTIAGGSAINLREHRMLLANMAKRSRYFIVNPALVDRPDKRGDQVEMGNRYFEGAASGAIMIGERPRNEEFNRLFDWPDAVLDLPYDSPSIDMLIGEVDREPDRQERMRRNNVVNALMRHDWAYRWESVLKVAGLAPMQGLLERKARLNHLARDIANAVPLQNGVGSEVGYDCAARPVMTSHPEGRPSGGAWRADVSTNSEPR
jgi:Glycosyl transferases group 1